MTKQGLLACDRHVTHARGLVRVTLDNHMDMLAKVCGNYAWLCKVVTYSLAKLKGDHHAKPSAYNCLPHGCAVLP